MKIVITGNIGCGKSTVTNFIHTLLPHYQVFDIDAVVRELYKDVDIKLALEREFGTSSKTEISDIVFFDEDAKNKLYDIINPYLIAAVESWQVLPDVIFDIPLFFEYFTSIFDKSHDTYVICVSCSDDNQLLRIKDRGGIAETKAQAIMAQQLSLDEKIKRSNAVIHNDSTKEETFKHILVLLNRMRLF